MDANDAARLAAKTRSIRGWFSLEAAMLFAWIDQVQKTNGVGGDIFEIGVHHGRSAIFLGRMVQPPRESLGVCDIFGDQVENVSRSGYGNKEIFERNIRKFLPDTVNIRIYNRPSKDLSPEEIGGEYRFFHIDGGHNPDETLSDLQLAAASVIREGVIALDDPLNPKWPGVSEGLFRFLSGNKDHCALVIGFNKLVLVRRQFADLYAQEFDKPEQRTRYKILSPWEMKILTFMDHPLRIFYENRSRDSVRARLARLYNRHGFLRGPLLRPIALLAKSLFR